MYRWNSIFKYKQTLETKLLFEISVKRAVSRSKLVAAKYPEMAKNLQLNQ